MQPDSLVVIKPYNPTPEVKRFITWQPIGDEKTIYTIREVFNHQDDGVYVVFNEGVIGRYRGMELAMHIDYVREIQPPMNLTELIEECIQEPVPA